MIDKLDEVRRLVSLALGVVGIIAFASHNVADAIFALALAIWIEPRRDKAWR